MNTPFSLDHSKGQSRLYDRIAQRASGYRTTFDVRVDGLTGEDEFIVTVFENIGLKDAVLDFGCGDGAFTVRLGHRSRQVIGLDVSQQMLGYAVNNLAESGNHNVSFMLATGQQLPLNSESIDAVVSRRGPATSRRCLPEVARTLRKGGILLELHVGDRHCIEIREMFGRGQNWPIRWRPMTDMPVKLQDHGLKILHLSEKETTHYFPTLGDLRRALETSPLVPDFDADKDTHILDAIAAAYGTEHGIAATHHRVTIIAKKDQEWE